MNPYRGEVALTVDGQQYTMRLTLGALAALEATMAEDSLLALVERFEKGAFSAADLIALLYAGLQGGGAEIDREALAGAQIEGGPLAAARAGALLLKRAFSTPDETV